MREAVIDEFAWRPVELFALRHRGWSIYLGGEAAAHVARANAKFHHHRRIGRLGELEALLDQLDDFGQVRPRIEQPDERLERIRVASLLRHNTAFAVVLAEH